MIAFAILGATLAITNPFDLEMVYAQDIEPNPYLLQDVKNDYYFEYGIMKKSVHNTFDRLLDYTDSLGNPVYVDYKQYDNGNNINFETATASYSFNKSSCALGVYDGGKITGSSVKTKTLSHTFKQATNGTDLDWAIHPSTDEPCTIQVSDKKIIATKSNKSVDANNASVGLSFDVIYDFSKTGTIEWTYDIINTDETLTNNKFGFTFVCDGTGCNDIQIDNQPLAIGDIKEKDDFKDKKIKVGNTNLDLKENQHGYTWALQKSQANNLTVDFTHAKKLAFGGRLIIDPTLNTDASEGGYLYDFDNSDTCNASGATDPVIVTTHITIGMQDSDTIFDCFFGDVEFDITSVVGSVDSSTLEIYVQTATSAENVDVHSIDFDDLSARTALQRGTSIESGADYYNAYSVSTTGLKSITLNGLALTEIQAEIDTGDGIFAVGFYCDPCTISTVSEYAEIHSPTGADPPALIIEYTQLQSSQCHQELQSLQVSQPLMCQIVCHQTSQQ